ncbi:hypothetical protein PR202_ga08329 [Eleusine coracana subsp. coracana]|uniref:Crossover junction endonuclease MUS81 n=1 Tax=Eleusine coracana subsp. coracana TaxID=191504 RepID=A0AAV5C1G9_ELECO|nr:hypothetical protein PR202_ga08329 [Eleusine coracana subsp. coracana]
MPPPNCCKPSPETACSFSATKRPCYYNAEVQTKNCRDKEIILCDSDSEKQSKLQSFTTMGSTEINMLDKDAIFMDNSVLAMPPRRSNESFLEAYEVVLTLDNCENFGFVHLSYPHCIDLLYQIFLRSLNLVTQVKHLPVGDGIWIARDRKSGKEYVLDFIVERKNVSDLHGSITDNRYRDQKLRLKRTSGYAESERRYGYLTCSIIEYFKANFSKVANMSRICPTYDEFVGKCSDLAKEPVSQIFALQLMQVPQVTEEAALGVIELYPTLLSLAQAYSKLDGDTRAQEEMLQNKNQMVNAGASRNIFKLVWADG